MQALSPQPSYRPWPNCSVDLSPIDYTLHTVFFGADIICFAYLILRSAFLPRTIGILLAIDGLAYIAYGFTAVLAPQFAAQLDPWIRLPALLGEGSLCLWLLLVGIDVERWTKWAATVIQTPPTQLQAP